MFGVLCALIFLLLSSLFSPTFSVHVQSEYRFILHSQSHDQTESPKILYRRFKPTGESYLFVAHVNKISQLNSDSFSLITERIIGPKNFSIFCFIPGGSCIPCNQFPNRPLPQGYHPDDCGPRLTNAFVKAWATSNFEPPSSNSSFESINLWEANIPANNDLLPVENALYVCYNVFHGFCERLQLTNISNAIPWKRRSSLMDFYPRRTSDIPIPVVNWNASLSSTLTVDGSHIFVGLEQDQFQDATLVDLDPISVRMRDFDYASKEPSVKSSLRFQENDLRIKYKFSFQYTLARGPSESQHLYVYFVSQQPNKSQSCMLETRLVRFCSTPYFFHSYVDLQLYCDGCVLSGRGNAQKQFGAFHMAVRGTVGTASAKKRFSKLVNSRVVPSWRQPIIFSEDFSNVLLVAFAPQLTKPNEFLSAWNHRSMSKKPLVRGTAIAFYTMAEVDVGFGIVINNCLVGRTSTGPSYLLSGSSKKCDLDEFLLSLLPDSYCPNDPMNYPISGSLPSERLSAPPVLMLDVDATGIAITRVAEEFTVLVVTTDEGELAKYEVEEDGKARLIASKPLTPRLRPLRGLTLDDTGLIAFAVSDEKVYRVELQNCSSFESCGACLALRDPHCGWCLIEGICTHKSACDTSWLTYRSSSSSCPEIISVDPPGVDASQGFGLTRALTLRPSHQLLDAFLNADSTGQIRHRPRHLLCTFRYRNSSEEQDPAWRIRGDFYAQSGAVLILESGKIACSLPRSTDLPVLRADEKTRITHVWLELTDSSGASSSSTYPLASGEFIIYDCRRFPNCQTCLNSRFDCVWHLMEGRCLSRASPLSFPPSSPQTSLDNSNFGLCAKSNCKCPSFMVEHEVTVVEINHPVSVVATVSNLQAMANRFTCFENCTGRWRQGIYNRTASTVTCNLPGIAMESAATPSGSSASNDPPAWHPDLLNFVSRGLVNCEIAINWHNDRLANQPELGHPLVNSQPAFLEVYECSRMATHCDSCLALPSRFSCNWCFANTSKSMGCFKAEVCARAGPPLSCVHPQLLQVIPENATLNGGALLTLRGINLGGHFENLMITAVFPDLKLKSLPCRVLPTDFRPFRQVTCRLNPSIPSDSPQKSRIELQLRQDDLQINTSLPFIFLTPKIEGFSPKQGPVSGGTVLRIYGQNLNIGASVRVYLEMEVNIKCEILSLSAELIECRTQAVDSIFLPFVSDLENDHASGIRSDLAVHHDESLTKALFQPYIFTPDPTIRTVTKTLIFLSGGTTIRVYGRYLDVIEQPWIVFYHDGMEFIEPCQSMLGYLSCLSPSLNLAFRRRRDLYTGSGTTVRPITNPSVISKIHSSFEPDDEMSKSADKIGRTIIVPYGFIMDNVSNLLVYGIFPVNPDPEVFPFAEGRLVESFTPSLAEESPGGFAEGGQLDLNGTSEKSPSLQDLHLLRFHGNFGALAEFSGVHALEELLIVVAIKSGENGINRTCKPTAVKLEEIRCELSREGLVEGIEYPVFIKFGRYLTTQPGVLLFNRLAPFGFLDRVVFAASSVIGVLALVACLFLAMWCRSRRTERDLEKRFQIRWIQQEKCVARAFKNDFIELQTHVDELVQDLNKGILPIRDYQTYCLFSLFPEYHLSLVRPANPHDMPPYLPRPGLDVFGDSPILRPHPLVSSFEVSTSVQEPANRGIFLFNRLLHNHHFLCLLIEAIESNRNIDARAKSQVASLLSIILHPDMEYFTQIILALITNLLRNSRDHGGDSRLLTAFRRAESVVAKMLSNWLTFLLYNFIREHAAEHLFILYRALRQQINTGPQDAVTGLARYTLDAATLLKSDLLSRKITLLVVDPEGLFGQLCPSELPVRVLSCDTVTQAKEKILDTIYRNTPYRNQLRPTDVHLRKIVRAGTECSAFDLLMLDWDLEVRRDTPNATLDGPPYRLNCLSDYKMNDGDVVALVRARSPHSPSNGGGTLSAALSINPTAAAPWGIHSCPPTGGDFSLPSHIHSNSLPLSNGQRQTPKTFNIRPTGGPSPLIWYHLERPTSADFQVQIERGGAMQEGKPSLCCRRSSSREKSPQALSSTLPTLTYTQQQQQFGGLDARSLRRWLASQSSSEAQSTAERVRTSQQPSRCGVRRTRLQTKRLFRKVGGSAAGEAVELAPNWADEQDDAIDRSMTKLPCEIFLNRLLRTRVSVAKYMDRVFEIIFGAVMDSQSPPLCIKFLFDFLDFQAESLGIHDPGVLHAWKANCLHLRFWNQILINLDYVFDIPLLRNTALERSFHSFSQAIAYACSPVLDKVTMDSPINKALFSSDIERHWLRVKKYFAEIKAMPAISLRDMNVSLSQHSKNHKNDFNVSWALYELYTHHVKLCYDTLVPELQTAVEAGNIPTPNLPYNAMGDTGGYPYSCGTSSLRGGTGLTKSQNVDWDPLCLLQTLQEVNSCMMAVASSTVANNSNGKASTLRTSASATTSPRFHRTFQRSHHQPTNGNGGGGGGGGSGGCNGAILRSAVSNSERRLPPLPSLP